MTSGGLTPDRARQILARFPGTRILVVGDIMLDRFVHGRVTRMSPEAPVPVVKFEAEHARLGGAANVAHNLTTLGASVTLVGVVGADTAADLLRAELTRAGIPLGGLVVDRTRRTVEKLRIVTDRKQQVARVDYEDDTDVSGAIEDALIAAIDSEGGDTRAVLVSDYLKGTVTPGVMRAAVSHTHRAIPVLVDPKVPHLDSYVCATLITPNQHEAEAATHSRIRTDNDAHAAARAFRTRAKCDAVIMTRGEHGVCVSSAETEQTIAAAQRDVADVTGAGDTVVATLALALAAGATLLEAAVLANHAAGIAVGKFGAATVTREEVLGVLGVLGVQ